MRKIFLFSVLLCTVLFTSAQKKRLRVDDFDNWNSVKSGRLSNDGKYLSFQEKPYKGDGHLWIKTVKGRDSVVFSRGENAMFSNNASFVVFKITPQRDTLRALMLKKTKKEKLPKDSVGIWLLSNKKLYKFPNLKSYKLGEDGGDWIALLRDKKKEKEKKPKVKDKHAPKTAELYLFNPLTNDTSSIKNVSEYVVSKNGSKIAYIVQRNDSLVKASVYLFDTKTQRSKKLFNKDGVVKALSISNTAKHLAFLHSPDTVKNKQYDMYFASKGKKVKKPTLTIGNSAFPKDWTISEHAALVFSRDESKLYFGTAPKPKPVPKDTLLASEKVKVDIWHWQDLQLQPEQLIRLDKDQKKNYPAVFHIKEKKFIQLTDDFHAQVRRFDFSNANFGLLFSSKPYLKEKSWTFENGSDYYFLNFKTGVKKLLEKSVRYRPTISLSGKYFAYYSTKEKCWYTLDVDTNKRTKHNIPFPVYDEEYDYPAAANPYGSVAWTKDNQLWIYDKYDIWSIDPQGKKQPHCITSGFGRKNNIQLRYKRLNKEVSYIDERFILISGFNEKTKSEYLYQLTENGLEIKKQGQYNFRIIQKAKNADTLLFKRSNFHEFGNYRVTDFNLTKSVQMSNANPQQQKFNWGTVELFKWQVDGKEEEGLLYKPENFDPNKKYPVLIYFYRLYSNLLNRHIVPKQSRSVINPTFYASNGYVVFIPNIRYQVGHPGKSAVKYVTTGAEALAKLPYIDKSKMGIQGQSWGGYQVAHIITQTNMFKAAWAGAPVSNMTSAYGGIRWGTGLSRMFQYEKTQSRIGATLYEKPELYIENSPIFHATNIKTPLAIMHNDKDGAVPWYQGIELFVMLRRLNKPAWMLNYNNEPHNLKAKSPNGKDLSIRMMQFFSHYLKDEPAPEWMTHGIPALQKGKNLGYHIKK